MKNKPDIIDLLLFSTFLIYWKFQWKFTEIRVVANAFKKERVRYVRVDFANVSANAFLCKKCERKPERFKNSLRSFCVLSYSQRHLAVDNNTICTDWM